MQENIFAGVEPGGYHDPATVRVLLCWLLEQCGRQMELSRLMRSVQSTGLVNYFTLCCSLDQLRQNGLVLEQEGVLTLTAKGTQAVQELSGSFPPSVREALLEAACKQPEQVENPASYTLMPASNGVLVRLTLQEQDYCPMELTLYTPDEASARQAAKRYLEDPVRLYQAIFEQLM